MAHGFKTGGKVKGSKNKATIERETAAEIDRARQQNRELAKDVLERLMRIAEGAASLHKPPTGAEIAKAMDRGQQPPTGDWGLFGEWFDRAVFCAKSLAPFQSPTFKAIAVMAPAPLEPREPVEATVTRIDDPIALSRVYARRLQASR